MLYPGLLRACGWSTLWSCVCLLAASGSHAAEEANQVRSLEASGRAAARQELRATHRYDPTIRQRFLEQQEADPEIVRMPELVVNESKTKLQFTRYAERKQRLDAANRPSLATGGDIRAVPGLSVKPHTDILAADARFKTSRPDVYRFTLWSASR